MSTCRPYQPGDRVTLTVEVIAILSPDLVRTQVAGYSGSCYTVFDPGELAAGKLEPRPLKVGDRVQPTASGATTVYAVKALEGGYAWLWLDERPYGTYVADCLTRVAPTA